MLRAKNIDKSIEGSLILRAAEAAVAPGEITVIIGPSGSGKSTLLRVMALIDQADKGTVDLNGLRYSFPLVGGVPKPIPWPTISMVFQQLFLWPHLTLKDNIALAARGNKGRVGESRMKYLADRLEIATLLDRHPNQVSLGQRQRAALARALVTDPQYLLLDEITSAQDVERIGSLLGFLEELVEEGMGLGIVTHLMGFARHAAQYVVFLDQGEVVEKGSRGILMTPSTKRLSDFLSLSVAG